MAIPQSQHTMEPKSTITSRLLDFHRDQRGVTATEYVVLVVLVACFVIAIVALFGQSIENLYRQAVDTLHRDVRW